MRTTSAAAENAERARTNERERLAKCTRLMADRYYEE